MSPERIERALTEVTREARNAPVPEIDWAALEAELPMTRVRSVPPRALNLRPWLAAAVFVLGGVGLGLALSRSEDGAHVAAGARATPTLPAAKASIDAELNGDTLLPGAHVVASERALSVVHAGHARWTLAPHSAGTLLATGAIVTVRLDSGSVTSRVTKSSRTETFAIEAGDVRVAAHGTEFVVKLGADGVSVSVTEGSVLVGPRSEAGQGQLLISPSERRYTLVGLPVEDDRALEALGALGARRTGSLPAAAASTQAGSAAQGRVETSPLAKKTALHKPSEEPSAAEEEDLAPAELAPEELENATRRVLGLTEACFKQRTIAGEGVRVTAQTSVTFRTLPQGGVNKVVFEPPLSPAVQACVNAGMGAIQTAGTKHGIQVSKNIDLER